VTAAPSGAQRVVLAVGLAAAIAVVAQAVSTLIERQRLTAVTVGTNVSGYTPLGRTVAIGRPAGVWWVYVGLVWLAGTALWTIVAYRLFRTQ
jgi:hypothetical protein